jgi:hypothetical protein
MACCGLPRAEKKREALLPLLLRRTEIRRELKGSARSARHTPCPWADVARPERW